MQILCRSWEEEVFKQAYYKTQHLQMLRVSICQKKTTGLLGAVETTTLQQEIFALAWNPELCAHTLPLAATLILHNHTIYSVSSAPLEEWNGKRGQKRASICIVLESIVSDCDGMGWGDSN